MLAALRAIIIVPAAASAGDADDGHTGDQGVHNLLCRQGALPQNPIRRLTEIQHR